MALRQTYLSLKSRLPSGSEVILVMRGRGSDELARSKELLDEFNRLKEHFSTESGFASASHYAWAKSNYPDRFLKQIRQSENAMARLRDISERARTHDVFLVCYEGYDKPCHRKLLLKIAEEDLGADVDDSPFLPESTNPRRTRKRDEEAIPLF
jgi:hypothetical protein